jgi:hypothetical protein
VKPEKEAVVREQLCKHAFPKQWHSNRHVIVSTDKHTAMDKLLEAVFSVGLCRGYIHTYITLHSMDPNLAEMTVGCGISHTITKTHTQYN